MRAEFDRLFDSLSPVQGSSEAFASPSGRFQLAVEEYATGENAWNCSRGIVTRLSDGAVLADVKRNYPLFWHAWVPHPNGREYLLCGEDYQGYTVVNLEEGLEHKTFPDVGYDGGGFCWAAVYPSPDGRILAVEGCYWACPYEIVFFDFRDPETLPLPELKRVDSLDEVSGWEGDGTFVFSRVLEFRKSDGVPYQDLSEEEQDLLDRDASLLGSGRELIRVSRGDLLPDS